MPLFQLKKFLTDLPKAFGFLPAQVHMLMNTNLPEIPFMAHVHLPMPKKTP